MLTCIHQHHSLPEGHSDPRSFLRVCSLPGATRGQTSWSSLQTKSCKGSHTLRTNQSFQTGSQIPKCGTLVASVLFLRSREIPRKMCEPALKKPQKNTATHCLFGSMTSSMWQGPIQF
jgi:hypothetical protein